MYHEPKPIAKRWRNSQQIRGVRAQLVAAINACRDGNLVLLGLKSARNLVDVCDQAIHTEVGHEPPSDLSA